MMVMNNSRLSTVFFLTLALGCVGTWMQAAASSVEGRLDRTTEKYLGKIIGKVQAVKDGLVQKKNAALNKLESWLAEGEDSSKETGDAPHYKDKVRDLLKLSPNSNAAKSTDWNAILTKREISRWHYLAAFMTGCLVSLTPCIYPLIPVTASALSLGAAGSSLSWLVVRCCAYFSGLAGVFAGLGYFSAVSGHIFGQWMANGWVVAFLIFFILLLAFSMIGLYDINFNAGSWFAQRGGSGLISLFFLGAASGLFASPCITPPLLTLLSLVAELGSPIHGLGLLFTFALGMSSLLLAVAIFSSALSSLPRPGKWMVELKRAIGFGMFFIAFNFALPFLVSYQILFGYGVLCAGIAGYYFNSGRKEAVYAIIQEHKQAGLPADQEESFWNWLNLLPVRSLLKSLMAIVFFGWAVFFLGRSYLVYNKTSLRKLALNIVLKGKI